MATKKNMALVVANDAPLVQAMGSGVLPRDSQALRTRLDYVMRDGGGSKLPAQVKRGREVIAQKTQLILDVKDLTDDATAYLYQRTGTQLRAGIALWDSLIEDLSDSVSEEQLAALRVLKDNFIAGRMQALQRAEETLFETLHSELEKQLSRPDYEWRRRTWQDDFMAGFTFDESELELRGLPPLTEGESLLNFLTLGWVARNRIKKAERERLQGGMPEVLDAQYAE